MTLDALRGKGAYRCGCGARIKITVPAGTRSRACIEEGCTFAAVSGTRIPMCAEHQKSLLLELMPDVLRTYPPQEWYRTSQKYAEKFGRPPQLPDWVIYPVELTASQRHHPNHSPKVYFIVAEDKVKIGTTNNLRRRFAQMSLPPSAYIAATIDGSVAEERRMHNKFAEERLGGSEWFKRSTRLDEFIEAVKRGKPIEPRS